MATKKQSPTQRNEIDLPPMHEHEIESFCPSSREAWRQWLEKNHSSAQSVWLVFYKASANEPTLSWSEAVDEALCFGWIDSVKKTVDKDRYKQYFSPRKPKSNWSKINKDKVTQLIREQRMCESGYQSIEIAKQNGSWTYLDEVEALVVPNDLKSALEQQSGALAFFENLSKSDKKILLYWVHSAKRPETREKRISDIATSASLGTKPSAFR